MRSEEIRLLFNEFEELKNNRFPRVRQDHSVPNPLSPEERSVSKKMGEILEELYS